MFGANDLYANPNKSHFFQTKIEYLGHIVSPNGIHPNPKKIETITHWPTPKNVHEIRSFLGLSEFYKNFVKNYSRIALPLTLLTKQHTSFHCGESQQCAFDTLKHSLSHSPVLQLFDFSQPFCCCNRC